MKLKYKLVCFDLDGTLIDVPRHIWSHIHEYLGTDNDERMIQVNKFKQGLIDYKQWFEKDLEMWASAGATKNTLLDAVDGVNMHQGALETIQKLKNEGIKIALISGSLNFVFEKIFKQHQMLFDHVFINKVFFGEGGRIIGGKHNEFDINKKSEGLKKICELENINLENTVFIGDNDNDVEIAKIAGLGIAFNCKSETLKQTADIIIENKDLRNILPFIIQQ